LYRITQEAVRNVIRHANAKTATVKLSGTGESLHLTIQDMGSGFDLSQRRSGGLGIIGMEERVRLVGGEITVNSKPGDGTQIDVRVPARVPNVEQ
jgi:signal transduction histidine kinase